MKVRNSRYLGRDRKGNMLVLILAVTAFIVLVILMFVLNYTRFIFSQTENVNALEAASLSAANELAKVVVEDDYYGHVSLSDYPPIGNNTTAVDGQPLPVFSINTILGTARLDLIIAHELNNSAMISLAQRDVTKAKEAAQNLTTALQQAVTGQGNPQDLDGNTVNILQSARNVYQQNLNENTATGKGQIQTFQLSLGWLDGGAPTITEVPKPSNKSQVPTDKQTSGKYKAFVNIPAHGSDFYFAGIGDKASLVDVKKWRAADGVRIPSAIKAEATHIVEVAGSTNQQGEILSKACAIPPGNKDLYPPGQLNIGFPHGRVPGIVSIRNIFDDPDFRVNPMPLFIPTGGDWPGAGPTLTGPVPVTGMPGGGSPYTVSDVITLGILDWLRSGKTKPRVDAVTALVDMDLFTVPGANQVSSNFQTYAFTGCPNDPNDPRMLALLNNSPDQQDAFLSMTTLGDVWDQLPNNSTTLQGNSTGGNQTVGNNPFNGGTLAAFWDAMATSNSTGWAAHNVAREMLEGLHGPMTPQETANANTLLAHAKWVIMSSDAITQQLTSLTAQSGLSSSGGGNFQWDNKLSFNSSWVGQFDNSHNYEHDKINPVTLAPTVAQVRAGSAQMNSSGASNNWFNTSNYGNDTSSFFFVGGYDNGMVASLPQYLGGGGGAGGPSGGGAPSGTNPNPPASLNEAIRLRFNNDGTVDTVYATTPFANIPVSENQLYGLALGAKTHGSSNPVTWTVTMRDNVRTWGRNSGGRHAGQPIAGSPPDYINLPAFGGAPGTSPLSYNNPNFNYGAQPLNPQPRDNYMSGGLSVEIQFRNPLVLKCNQDQENLTDGDGNVDTVTPPIPPGLL